MARDVYAGDEPTENAPQRYRRCRYLVITDLEPLALGRVVQQLTVTNVVPESLVCARAGDDRLQIIAVLPEVGCASAEFVRRKLVSLTCVHDVVMDTADQRDQVGRLLAMWIYVFR